MSHVVILLAASQLLWQRGEEEEWWGKDEKKRRKMERKRRRKRPVQVHVGTDSVEALLLADQSAPSICPLVPCCSKDEKDRK